jgi:hypothetical protein
VPPIRNHLLSALSDAITGPIKNAKLLLGILSDGDEICEEENTQNDTNDEEDVTVWDLGVWMEDEHGVRQMRTLGCWGPFGLFTSR